MISTLAYAPELQHAIQIAQSLAKEYHNLEFSAAHLLQGVLHNEVGLASQLAAWGEDIHYLRDWAMVRLEDLPKTGQLKTDPTGDDSVRRTFEVADVVKLKLSEDLLSPLAVLVAMCKPGVGFSEEQLKTFPLQEKGLIEKYLESASLAAATGAPSAGKQRPAGPQSLAGAKALFKYCVDKTALAKEGKIDPIVGRDRETRMAAEILGRRTKPNVIIVGDPGVGKTALVDGFALNIIEGNVPTHLKEALLLELDVGSLVAGASYKGEVEDRLKNIIREIKELGRVILFIDEIHVLLDEAGPVGAGAANLLKPELARGEITVIGATTTDEFRKFIESEEAFNRRFETLKINEPDTTVAVKMLEKIQPFYEEHHQLPIEKTSLETAVRLAQRYLKDRRLPDSAIDLVDRTMAAIRMMNDTSAQELDRLDTELASVKEQQQELAEEERLAELKWFHFQLEARISPILLGQLTEEDDIEQYTEPTPLEQHLDSLLGKLRSLSSEEKESVEPSDIAAVVSHKTGIPMGKLQSQEREKLLNLEAILRERVVGQDHALQTLAAAIMESRSGLTKEGQPIGSFFFLGPTGTGKTELAKSLAEFLFNDEKALIRFDMSEFKEEHSAALLYGAPPGYIGYKEGGLLVNKIRQQPYAIVLFDEIEKAHNSVFDLFLQILDEGQLHDRLGKEGDFSNAIILFTSNIGSDWVVEQFNEGKIPETGTLLEIMGGYFRPEFLGRLTEIVPFAPISEEVVEKIFEIQLKQLAAVLEKKGITLVVEPEAKKHLAMQGFTPKYGARPLRGVIRNQLRRPISQMIIRGEVEAGATIHVGLTESHELSWNHTSN
ncbi:MAG: ATP-dependent Clp protease ATP-binding subunit [Bacteroidota bacterium]